MSIHVQRPVTRILRSYSTHSTSRQRFGEAGAVTLADGRVLGFAEYGAATGEPLLWFHGLPGSRIEISDWGPLLQRLNVRLFGVDRPGYGLSTFQPNRKLLDWPGDVQQLAHYLGLKQFHVMGGSGGGPYAIACAKALPKESLRGAGVIAGAGPRESGLEGMASFGKIYYSISAWPSVTALTRKFFDWTVMSAVRDPDPEAFKKKIDKVLQQLPKKDRAVFDNEIFLKVTVESLREAFRQGSRGTADDSRIMGLPWGFRLEDIDCNMVKLYYGTEDVNTPVGQGRYMAQHIKNAVLKEYPGDTHFTLSANHDEEILKDFMGYG